LAIPGFHARIFLERVYEAKGDLPSAVAEFQRASKIETSMPWPLAELGHAYARSGKKSEAQQVLKELQDLSRKSYVAAYYAAIVYAGLGEKEQAIASLEKAYVDRSHFMTFVNVDPELNNLHPGPAF